MRTIFSSEQIVKLKRNLYVFNCTTKSAYYTYEFKIHAIDLYEQGINSKEIWRRAGFDIEMWKKNYFTLTLRDWKRIVARDGIKGLSKTGGLPYDRGPNNTDKDKLKRLELQVKYLSFFGHMKDELDYKSCQSIEELHSKVTEYMQYYNYERKQWTRNKMAPVEYRNHLLTLVDARVMGFQNVY